MLIQKDVPDRLFFVVVFLNFIYWFERNIHHSLFDSFINWFLYMPDQIEPGDQIATLAYPDNALINWANPARAQIAC